MSTSTTSTVKQQVRSILERLPEDCTLEDVQYQLFVMQRVQEGLAQIDRGEGIPHDEAKRRLNPKPRSGCENRERKSEI